MTSTVSLEILKQAIINEKRGYAFYKKVAHESQNEAVKHFFESMAQEELSHINVLSLQFREYSLNGTFSSESFNENEEIKLTLSILDCNIMKKISAAGFEAAAISASIALEQRSIDIYSKRSEESDDPEEKRLYLWLSTWERQHLNMLMEIDRALLDEVWGDNNFWPF